jgi:hypothetical protein
MLVKVFRRGTGGGRGPVDYCTAVTVPAFDPATRRRIPGQTVTRHPPPEVLAGDPERTRMLIDASPNRWRYTSGVIAFAREDAPTEDEQRALMASFEEMAFAGLEREQYDILWIRHTHEGATELHFVVPRIELRTMKALNIAPPGHESLFDAWRDAWNYERGWARPDDPARARLVRQGDHAIKTDVARVRAGLATADDPKTAITEWLADRIAAGMVTDRAGIVASLSELGEVTRQGRDYVSVKPQGFDKAVRLKGAIYEQGFDGKQLGRDSQAEAGLGAGADRGIDTERAGRARRELEAACKRRAAYNVERYRERPDLAPQPDHAPGRDADRAAEGLSDGPEGRRSDVGDSDSLGVAAARGDRPEPLAGHLRRELGTDSVDLAEHPNANGDEGRPRAGDSHPRADSGEDYQPDAWGGTAPGREGAAVHHPAAGGQARNWLGAWKAAGSQILKNLKGTYDRARETLDRWAEEFGQAVRAGHAAAGGAELGLAAAGADFGRAASGLEQSARQLELTADRACGVIAMQRDDELLRFKSEINLVEYAESQGYEIARRESSRSSTVMRRGDDKVVVATAEDGHGIYFSVRDESDNGSIIDFVQRRLGLSLGQVRRELRPWIGGGRATQRVHRRPEAERPPKPTPSTSDRQAVLAAWMKMRPAAGRHAYLERERKLSIETLSDPRFIGMVRLDARGNAVFPHYDVDGLSGYELKNEGFTGFAVGGVKAVWHSSNLRDAPRVVLVESAIDAMSHAQLTGDSQAGYVSIGGAMSPYQRTLVQRVLARAAERGVEIVIATDADQPGEKLATEMEALAPAGATLSRQRPAAGFKDWNDQLRAEAGGSLDLDGLAKRPAPR